MEDLFDVQTRKMDVVLKDETEIQAEELVSKAVYEISSVASRILDAFQLQRFTNKSVNNDEIRRLVMQAIGWTTALFYCLDIELPELEDVDEFADEFDPEVAVDVILAALSLHRALADMALDYFCNEEADPASLEQSLMEMLASLTLITRRLGEDLQTLIMTA